MRDFAVAAETTTNRTNANRLLYQDFEPPPPPPPRRMSPQFVIDEFHMSYLTLHDRPRRKNLYLPKTTTKRVSFAEDALLYSGNVTEEEVKRSWYSQKEFVNIKQGRRDTIGLMKDNDFDIDRLESEGYCLRGFEPYFSPEINRAMKFARVRAYQNVLEEQERQRVVGVYSPEAIREQSCEITGWARETALRLAANDALEARRILTDHARLQTHAHLVLNSAVSNTSRAEFARSSSMRRQKSNRKLRLQDEAEQDERRSSFLLKKLEHALEMVEKMDLGCR